MRPSARKPCFSPSLQRPPRLPLSPPRRRMSLVRLQTGLKDRVHAILHRHGILHDFADLFGAQGRRMLTRLAHDAKNPRLRESGRATLKGFLQLLDHLRRQIAAVTLTLYRQRRATPEAERLQGLPGVGPILAHTILAEGGDFGRFRSGKHLARIIQCAVKGRASSARRVPAKRVGSDGGG